MLALKKVTAEIVAISRKAGTRQSVIGAHCRHALRSHGQDWMLAQFKAIGLEDCTSGVGFATAVDAQVMGSVGDGGRQMTASQNNLSDFRHGRHA